MKRKNPRRWALLPLYLLLCWGLTSMACAGCSDSGTPGITVDISQPANCTAQSVEVGYCVTDTAGDGFAKAEVKVGRDGVWQDVTDCLERWDSRYTGRVRLVDNCPVSVRITGCDGGVYEKTSYIDCFAQGTRLILTGAMAGDSPTSTDTVEAETPPVSAPEPKSPPDIAPRSPTALTPDGQGTAVDNVTGGDAKEFFTITAGDGKTFYLIIDRQRGSENVYLLDTVKESDLLSLAEKELPPQSAAPNPRPVCICAEKCAPGAVKTDCPVCILELKDCIGRASAAAPELGEPSRSGGAFLLVLIAVLAAGGTGYYLKIYRPKRALDSAEDLEELTAGEEAVNEDHLPPHFHSEPEEPNFSRDWDPEDRA